jgi:hypothetical protein
MTPTLILFLGLTITLPAVVVLYVANLLWVRAEQHPFPMRALVPFLTPVLAWRGGARGLPLAFALSVGLYLILWVGAGLVMA